MCGYCFSPSCRYNRYAVLTNIAPQTPSGATPMSSNLLNMALQLSVQDIFSSSWFSSALMNRAWTDIMRSSVNGLIRNTSAPDMLGVALGGRLRGDAAMLRQASSNVSEAQSMMRMAADAAGNIAGQLKEAYELAEKYRDAPSADLMAQYVAINNNIKNIIQNTKYNGIALLDGSDWHKDSRLSVFGNAASVHIQAGDSGFPLTFSNMSGTIPLPRPNAPTALTVLNTLQSSAQTLADLYSGRAGSLQSQAGSLQSQAKILEEAAAQRAKTPVPSSTENILLNLILRDTGGIFSGKG